MVLLLADALLTRRRRGDAVKEALPALLAGAVTIAYLTVAVASIARVRASGMAAQGAAVGPRPRWPSR